MPTKTQIREVYDFIANDYDDYMESTNHAQAQRSIVEQLAREIQGKVLDVGTGTGIIALAIAKKIPSSEVTGTDISESMMERAVENARSNDQRVNFLTDDIEESLFTDQQFDTVTCCLGMLWFIHKEKALKEMVRICKKPGGKIILIEEEGETLRSRQPLTNKRLCSFFSKIEKLESPISLDQIKDKMKRLGYGVTKIVKARVDEDHQFVGTVFERKLVEIIR